MAERRPFEAHTRGGTHTSLAFVGSEALDSALVVDEERTVLVLLDHSVIHELRHEVHGRLALALVLLHLPDLVLEQVVLRELGRLLQFLPLFGRLLVRDLLLGALALAAGLKQVGRDALAGCKAFGG
jgi:hypothetical protein